MIQNSNKDIYATVEFDSWAQRTSLIRSERFLLERYLKPELATVEAGTAGGRILLEIQQAGFHKLSGFDIVEGLIRTARERDPGGRIAFDVMDAVKLSYPDEHFGQAIYLQQIVSLIDKEEDRHKSVHEAYRILQPGSIALFSFLCMESRSTVLFYRAVMTWLKVLRTVCCSNRSIQSLPWLKLGGKFNLKALVDVGPYVYWFRVAEAETLLTDAGFDVISVGSDLNIEEGTMQASALDLEGQSLRGHLYFVCRKPFVGNTEEK